MIPQSIFAIIGSLLVIACNYMHFPHAELTSSITSVYRLTFNSVTSEDTGTYICQAYNDFGVRASAQITLQLSGKSKYKCDCVHVCSVVIC